MDVMMASGESLADNAFLAARASARLGQILRGRRTISMMIDYFKTNRSLQEQCRWQCMKALQWQ